MVKIIIDEDDDDISIEINKNTKKLSNKTEETQFNTQPTARRRGEKRASSILDKYRNM